MDYLTVRETAETWNLSLRTVQQLCAQGRIPGAKKFGKFWAIPAGAAKPQVSQQDQLLAEGPSAPGGQLDAANLMPLMNTPFLPGQCRAAVEAMAHGPRRDIALAEYHYFTGHPEEAAQEAQPYLDSDDVGARLSACLVYAYANLSIGEICRAKFALGELSTSLAAAGERSPQFQAASAFVAAAGAVLLHLPLPEGLPDPGLPPPSAPGAAGLRPVYPGPLPLPERGVRPQRRLGGGGAVHGGGGLPHPRPLPPPGGGNGLHEPEADPEGQSPPPGRLGPGPARRPHRGLRGAPRPAGGHAGGRDQTRLAGGFQAGHRHHLPLFRRVAKSPQPRDRPRRGR